MTRLRAVLFSALSLISLPASALGYMNGQTSMYGVRSAYTLGEGNYSYGLSADTTYYQGTGGVQLPLQDMVMSVHQGVSKHIEAGFYFPARYALGTNNLEFQKFGFSFKFQTDETPATKDAVAVTLYGGVLSADASKGVGSGLDNFGLSFDYTNTFSGRNKVHSNLGVEHGDALTVISSTSGSFDVNDKMFWRVGLEFPFGETNSFDLGLAVTNNFTTNTSSAMLMPSYSYLSRDRQLRYNIGIGYNTTPDTNLPIASAYIGMSYRFVSPNKHIADLEKRINLMQMQLDDLSTSQARQDTDLALIDQRYNYLYDNDLPIVGKRLDNAEKRIDNLEKRQQSLAAMKAKILATPRVTAQPKMSVKAAPAVPVEMGKGGKLTVEIINRSGDAALLKRISNRIKQKGYDVVMSKSSNSLLKQSYVYYRNGYAKQAVTLGHALPKNQIVSRSAHLPKGVDLKLELGADLK